MFIVWLYTKSVGLRLRKNYPEFPTIMEAIEYGDKSGRFYTIYDDENLRLIDWHEIHEDFTSEWFYNENDLLWEKLKDEAEEEDDQ